MKRNSRLLFALICAAGLVHAAAGEPAAQRQYVDGAVMAQQVQSKLQAEGFSPLTKINVEAQDNGVVTLKGTAASDAEAARVVALAKEVSGVMAVESEILVKRIP